jgi:hypothetical protein
MEREDRTQSGEEYISLAQAARMSRRTSSRSYIGDSLDEIEHIASEPDEAGRRAVLLVKRSFLAWDAIVVKPGPRPGTPRREPAVP